MTFKMGMKEYGKGKSPFEQSKEKIKKGMDNMSNEEISKVVKRNINTNKTRTNEYLGKDGEGLSKEEYKNIYDSYNDNTMETDSIDAGRDIMIERYNKTKPKTKKKAE